MKKFILIIGSVLLLAFASVYAIVPGSSESTFEIAPVGAGGSAYGVDASDPRYLVTISPKYMKVINLAKKVSSSPGYFLRCELVDNGAAVMCGHKRIANENAKRFLSILRNSHAWDKILTANKVIVGAANGELDCLVPNWSSEMTGSVRTVKLTKLTRTQLDAINSAKASLNTIVTTTLSGADIDVLYSFASEIICAQDDDG